MQKLVWQNANGVELDLTSGNYGITEWEGFSNTSLNIQQQQVPFQDGGVFLDALIEQRELSVTLAMQDNNNLELRYQQRRELISALNPKLGEGYLIYTNDFISKRIKCVPQIPLFETHNSDTVGTPKASLSWTACSPYWEDLEETSIELPMGQEVTIENEGDVPVGVEIQIETGSITEPQIANATTGKYVKLTDSYEGDILIDTKTGEKKAQSKRMKYNWSSGNRLKGMAEGEGIQVICGGTAIWKKPDINTIYSLNGILNMTFTDVIYFAKEEIFVGVGAQSISGSVGGLFICISKDGKSWEKVYEETSNTYLLIKQASIVFAEFLGELYVAFATHIYRSTDGVNWSKNADVFESNATQIISIENRQMLIVATEQKCKYSTDGTTWANNLSVTGIDSLTYSETQSILVVTTGSGTFYVTSILTDTWTTYTDKQSVKNIIYIKEKNAFYGNLDNVIYTSTDGVNWTVSQTLQGVAGFNRFYYSGYEKKVYALGAGVICTQSANNEWAIVRASAYKASVTSMNYISETGKYFMGVGTGIENNLMVSTDFKNWQIKQVESGSSSAGVYGVAYSPTLELYCVLAGTGIYSSTDLDTWTNRKSLSSAISSFSHKSIIWVEELGLFFATTTRYIYKSSDGISWTQVYASQNVGGSTYGTINEIVWASDKQMLIALENDPYHLSRFVVSSDGATWTPNDFPVYFVPTSITYSSTLGKFCVACTRNINGGTVLVATSTDGANWNVKYLGLGGVHKVVYSDKLGAFYLVAVRANTQEYAGKGMLFISRDGESWVQKEVDHCYSYGHTTFSNCLADENERKIMIGGYDSLLIESYFADYENAINTLSQDSDMTLNLDVGENKLNYSATYGGGTCTIKYRQKYIGV